MVDLDAPALPDHPLSPAFGTGVLDDLPATAAGVTGRDGYRLEESLAHHPLHLA